MTSINLTPDDVGVQKLRATNEAPTSAKAVTAVSAKREIHKTVGAKQIPAALMTDRRQGERRQVERRRHDQPVLLDTRSQRERRSHTGQRRTDKTDTSATPDALPIRGIDTEV